MLCSETVALLDRGLTPSSADPLRARLGFHLAACATCRTYRTQREGQNLLAALLAEPLLEAARPLYLAHAPRASRRTHARQAQIGAALLVAGALASAALTQSAGARGLQPVVPARPPAGAVVGIALVRSTALAYAPGQTELADAPQQLSNAVWLAAHLAVPVRSSVATNQREQVLGQTDLRVPTPVQPARASDPNMAWASFAEANAPNSARSQLMAFAQAGPQQPMPQVIVDGAVVEHTVDAVLGNLPLEMGRTLFLPDDPQPPTPPPPVVAVPSLPASNLPPALPPVRPATPATTRSAASPAPRLTAVSAPVRSYVVQRGDTLSAIALRVYGNASLWPQIYAANRSVIGANPDLIFPSQRYTVSGHTSGSVVRPYLPVRAVTPAPPGQPYTVKKGDSMRGIALGYYNNELRWKEIYNANKALIPDPDNLRIGIKLKIP
ncbi:MAG: LysM peptidoglycan-binding domain-containing protein [Roseiflexaceae bacterium]|nr:LysM peptidoglycan-binding domain-containing protein [Roseiflexaceae bacterium]